MTASPSRKGDAIKKALEAIDQTREQMVKFLSGYVQQQSVNASIDSRFGEGAAQRWLGGQLESWRCFTRVDVWERATNRPNVVSSLKGSQEGQGLLFLGHTDVVPVVDETQAKWTAGPWSGEVRDGNVYGRGACDMKGGNAAFLWAMKTIAEARIELRKDVYGALVVGEETGEHEVGVDQVLERGYVPDFVICAEPTRNRICPVTPGMFMFKLVVRGKAIHTSQKYRSEFPQPDGAVQPGVDAVRKTVKFLQAFEDLERQWAHRKYHPLLPRGVSNITPTRINGGEYLVALPERCEVIFNVWYAPDEKFEDVASEIRGFVSRIAENDDWMKAHPPALELPAQELPVIVHPIDLPLDHPGCRAVAEAYESSLGRGAEFDGFTAACDLNFLRSKGVNGVILGPGDLADGVHGIDERVPIEQLVDCSKVYAASIINWCA